MKRFSFLGLLPLALPLAGCYISPHSSGPDRAIEIYRQGRTASGAISFRRDEQAGGAEAPSPAPLPSELDVDAAVALAKKNSTRLAELRARVVVARAGAEAKGRRNNPELRVSQLQLDQALSGEPEVRGALRFRPERPGELDAKIAEARANEAAAKEALRAEEMAIEAEVRWLFDDVLLLDKEIAAAEAVAKTRKALSDRMKAMLEAAEATSLDEAMAELSLVDAEAAAAEQKARRGVVLGQLLDLMGADPRAEVRLEGELKSAAMRAELPSEKALVEAALKNRPEIAVAAANIDAADARLSIERGQRYPWFTFLEGGYHYRYSQYNPPGLAFTFQMGLELPIFDTNRSGVAASKAAEEAAHRALAAQVESIAREVRDKRRAAEAARALWIDMERRALPVAERAGKAAERGLSGGHLDAARALDVDERRVVAELRVLGLLRRYREAVAELERAVGGKLPP